MTSLTTKRRSIYFTTWDDEKIKTANTGTNVFVKANIQVQDAIEDLNFNVYME